MPTTIDQSKWKRKSYLDFFRKKDYPLFNLCFNVDITNLVTFHSENNLEIYLLLIYFTTLAVNSIHEFKTRVRGDKVVLHDMIHPSFTVINADEIFNFCTIDFNEDFNTFKNSFEMEREVILKEKDLVINGQDRDDLIFITSIPWITFTSFQHPIQINKNQNDSVPRLSWGKYFSDGGKKMLPFSVQVHHGLMDGFHVGKFYEEITRLFANPGDRIKFY